MRETFEDVTDCEIVELVLVEAIEAGDDDGVC